MVPGSRRSPGKRGVGKRGPRNRGGAAAMERTSAQRAFRRHGARVHSPFVSPAKAGAQEPRWRRCHGTDLSAGGSLLARCLSSLEEQPPLCCGRHGGPMAVCFPSSARSSLGPGVRRENEGLESGAQELRWGRCHGADLSAVGFLPARCSGSCSHSFPPRKRGPRSRGGAVVTERTSAQWVFCRHDARVLLKRQRAPCRGGCGGSMSFWPPPSAPWSLDPDVRRETMKIGRAHV